MAIDNDKKAHLNLAATEDSSEDDSESKLDLVSESPDMWHLGSPEGREMNLRAMAVDLANVDPQYCSLDEKLRNFIACNNPEEACALKMTSMWVLNFNSKLCEKINLTQVWAYKSIILNYQSVEDWTEGSNILRCNPNFHGRQRFDCVIIHDDAPKPTVA
jgi:hypothetical protein